MAHSLKYDYYVFRAGDIEKGESPQTALEVNERHDHTGAEPMGIQRDIRVLRMLMEEGII